jgi:hypothetical protein
MNVDWQAVGSIVSIVSALAAIGALFFVIINIWLLNRTLSANINSTLLQDSIEIIKYVSNRTHRYDYFYNAKRLNLDDTYKIEVLCACEMLANYCNLVLVTLNTLEANERAHWQRFVQTTLAKSPQLRAFIDTYRTW